MSVETYNSTDSRTLLDSIRVSDTAVAHFRRQLQKQGKSGVRISLKESGCTGYKYVIEEVSAPADGDAVRQLSEQVSLFVEPSCLPAIKGLEIDFTQTGLNQNLILNNPNIKNACGCGESFSV